MLDFLFAVSHPAHWHSINMQQHPDHYALLPRTLGSSAVSTLQNMGGQVWYNVDCNVAGEVSIPERGFDSHAFLVPFARVKKI
jgi:translocator assembly and maintenance protein 41